MDASKTEIDAFKVFSNVDFVDWSRAPPRREEERKDTPRPSPPVTRPATPRPETHHDTPRPETRHDTPRPMTPRPSTPRPLTPIATTPRVTPRAPLTPRHDADPPEVRRPLPRPRKYSPAEENEDYEVLTEKEGILDDLHAMERSGMRLSRKWDVHAHSLDELQFEYDRLQTEQTATTHVTYMKTGLQLGMSGIEMALMKAGITSVNGWSGEACKDMTQYNRPLTRIYKKYWRTQHTGPVVELGMLVFGSLAWTVAKNNVMGSTKPTEAPTEPRMRPPPPPGSRTGPSWNFNPPAPTIQVIESHNPSVKPSDKVSEPQESHDTSPDKSHDKSHDKPKHPESPKNTRSMRSVRTGRKHAIETVLSL